MSQYSDCSRTLGSVLDRDLVCDQAKFFSLVLSSQKELKTRDSGRRKQQGIVG